MFDNATGWLLANGPALIKVILVFGAMIFFHELGHFILAKRIGIRVHEFAMGFGPRLLRFRRGETDYCLRIFPVGGFVNIEGENEAAPDPSDMGNFQNRSVGEKLKVLAAGCVMNFITGLLILLLVGLIFGVPVGQVTTRVEEVFDKTPAQVAGLQVGDVIRSVNGVEFNDGEQLTEYIHRHPQADMTLVVDRNGQTIQFQVKTYAAKVEEEGKEISQGRIGFRPSSTLVFAHQTPMEVVANTVAVTGRIFATPYIVYQLIKSKALKADELRRSAAGPVGIGQMLFELAKRGTPYLLYFAGFISIYIGYFNLFPIPALDGARIIFVLVGAIRGRPIDQEKEGLIHYVGLAALLILVLLFTMQDILRIWSGKSILPF